MVGIGHTIFLTTCLLSHALAFELIPAVFTPFSDDGSAVDLSLVPSYASFLSESQNISTVFISGTNGESLSLALEERKALVDAWAATEQRIIVMVSAESVKEAVDFAGYVRSSAEKNENIVGVAAMSSSFFKPGTAQDLVDYVKPIAEASGEKLPLYYYHIPSMTGATIDMGDFQDLAVSQIPTFSGLKYTDTDLFTLRKTIISAPSGVTHFFGKDEILLSGLAVGSAAAVGSTYNFMAPVAYQAAGSFFAGDLAAAQSSQDEIVRCVDAFLPYSGIPAQKAIMKMVGMDLGLTVRPPLRSLT
eukprot:CAMPEP_0197559642 /NCGR_PEP_ID=MMETSP1320-20131121/21627_1 /TAXON_ID=91990 /ORGANISM="Bolidomonas sp., Strain RCC2347" /LENGTH=302 /DNA_ID=CAMNT_0043121103 /DNA_START=23 /DNA_END=927 /DNA_ORIENTATION=+